MICDLAETYHIYDYREYPPILVGTLLFGLKDDSRVKMKLAGTEVSIDRLIQARIADELSFIAWTKTEDCQGNRNRPKSIAQQLLGITKKEEYVTFETMEEFQKMWDSI